MRYFLIILFIFIPLISEELEEIDGLVEVKDTSGLSDNAVRTKAKKQDAENSKKVSIVDIAEIANDDGSVDIKKLQALWEDQSPTPNGYDWIQSKSGEWFKGDINAMFDDDLEFDSDEIGLYTFDFDDVTQIKSYHLVSVNIDGVALFTGIIRLKDDKIRIIQGDQEFVFLKSQVVSFAHQGESNFEYWSGKGSVSFDQQKGNTDQVDYSARLKLQRRTAETRLTLEYTGNVSYVDGKETKSNQRISETFDMFLTKKLYWTPLYSEYYKNEYQNINSQITASMAIGYKFIDTKNITWSISSGPGIIYTKYDTVYDGSSSNMYLSSPNSQVISGTVFTKTNLNIDITDDMTFKWDYQFDITEKNAGKYKHHMVTTLEIDLTEWLTLDFSYVWDRLEKPEKDSDGNTPYKDDYQTLMGLGIDF